MQNTGGGGDLLRNTSFRTLLVGHGISSLGDWVATFGLMFFVGQLTKGSSIEGLAISGILGFRILPALIAAPIASSITDRFDRRRTMIASDLGRAALIALVPFVPNLAGVYVIAFFLEGVSLIFLPARDATVPNIVTSDKLAGANGLIMILQWGTIPLAGALLFAADAGARALANIPFMGFMAGSRFALPFFFDAASFLVSAWAITSLPRSIGKPPEHKSDAAEEPHLFHGEMWQGVGYLLEDKGRRDLIYGMALATAAGGALFAIGIPYVRTTMHASISIFAALIILWGVGMAGGAFLSQRSDKRESELFRTALGASGIILVVMAVIPHPALALGVSPIFGAGLAIAMVLGITIAQRSAPDEVRGRVMAAVHVMSRICLIGGSVIVGGIAALMGRLAKHMLPGWDGNRYAFLIAGAALFAGGLAAKTGATILEEAPDAPGQAGADHTEQERTTG